MSQPPKKDSIIKTTRIVVSNIGEEEDAGPPPPGHSAKYESIGKWLTAVSKEKVSKAAHKYKFGLFESPSENVLFVVGEAIHDESPERSVIKIEHMPLNAYYTLKPQFFKGVSGADLCTKIVSELKAFTQTAQFKKSFFSKSDSLFFERTGETIWKRNP